MVNECLQYFFRNVSESKLYRGSECEHLKHIFFSKAIFQSDPQINLGEGISLVMIKRKNSIKRDIPNTYLLFIVFYIMSQTHVSTSSSKQLVNIKFVEVDVDMLQSQKCPSFIFQVTIRQKKINSKTIHELQCRPFWLGFQTMNNIVKSQNSLIESSVIDIFFGILYNLLEHSRNQ